MGTSEEIDRLIALHVMGWVKKGTAIVSPCKSMSFRFREKPCPVNYSSDIKHAWDVLDVVINDIEYWKITSLGDKFEVVFDDHVEVGKTAPLAICLAALALRGKYKDG